MMRGFWSVSIRMSNPRQTILHVLTLAMLLLTLQTNGSDECEDEVLVRRHTAYEAVVGGNLIINCTVKFCNDSPPTVSWVKHEQTDVAVNVSSNSRFKTEWKLLQPHDGVSYLIFRNIVSNDSGLYQCRTGGTSGHNIRVSVNDDQERRNETNQYGTNSTSSGEHGEELWTYVCAAAGIVAFVVIVIIISVASMQGCKGKSKKETSADSRHVNIPMLEQPSQGAGVPPPTRRSPSAPPTRRSTHRNTAPPQLTESESQRDEDLVYSKVRDDRKRHRNTLEEDGNSLVYAALNHQLPARPAARPRRPLEESSEYAAIRVSNL